MSKSQRTTVYLEPDLHRALRLKAAETRQSMSLLLNEAVRASLAEDHEDLVVLDARAGEPNRPFEEFLKELADEGRL